MSKHSVVLIGMPGSGKSTVGVLLAKALGLPFVDTDLVLQCREGALLRDILARKGLEGFLDAEERAVCEWQPVPAVIATGGSVVLREKAVEHLRSFGVTVFLDVDLDVLVKRIRNMKTRGIALPPGQSFEELFRYRRPYYLQSADLTVRSGGFDAEETVAAVLEALRKYGEFEGLNRVSP